MKELKIGSENTVTSRVTTQNTASAMGSGTLDVFATPAVAALMEKAASELVEPFMDEGITTVGTLLSLRHLSASPLGADISAKAVLLETDGRKFSFEVSAYDNAGLIAEGKHERCSVKTESFMDKAVKKIII